MILHKNIIFRTRPEARWALFMDEMGVRYAYQTEGDKPDFWLPTQGIWLEILESPPPLIDGHENPFWDRMREFAKGSQRDVLVLGPELVLPNGSYEDESSATLLCSNGGEDEHYLWCECSGCGRCELQFDGRAERIGCKCGNRDGKRYNYDSLRLKRAYLKGFAAFNDGIEVLVG